MKLYELTNDFQRLFDSLEDMTENAELTAEEKAEAEKVWFDTLECVEAEFTDKAENVAAYVKVLNSEAKMLEAEEKALKARREQKVKHGDWLKPGNDPIDNKQWICSECKGLTETAYYCGHCYYNYCPNCGTRMDGDSL